MKGYIRLHRNILTHPAYQMLTPTERGILLGLLSEARYLPGWQEGRGYREHVPRGYLLTSQRKLAKLFATSPKTLQRACRKLEKLGFVACEVRHIGPAKFGYTRIHVTVYDGDPSVLDSQVGDCSNYDRSTVVNMTAGTKKENRSLPDPSQHAKRIPVTKSRRALKSGDVIN